MLLHSESPKAIPVMSSYVCVTRSVVGGPLPNRVNAMRALPGYQDRSWLKCMPKASDVESQQALTQGHAEEVDDDYLTPEQVARLQVLSDRLTPDRLMALVEAFPTPPHFYSE